MKTGDGHDDYASIADLYDHVVPHPDREDVGFFVEAAKQAGGPVLEIGCGTGRVLIPCARAGVDVVGLDSSASMLGVCEARLRHESPEVRSRVKLVHADMRRFDLGRTFALVTLPFRPFQHLVTVEDQLACLDAVRRHLVERGRLILDVFNPSLEALVNREGGESGDEPEFSTPDGRRVTRRVRIAGHDRFNQVQQVELIYYVTYIDGRHDRLVHAFSMRYLFRFEVEHLLARSGFAIEHLYAGYDKSPYGSRYPGELVFDALRRPEVGRP
jgi:SAM-dependent methyltransferase